MAKERTPEQALTNAPFPITFGDTTFKVKRLTIGKAKAWRAKVIEHDQGLLQKFPDGDPIERIKNLSENGQEMVLDLVLAYIEEQGGDKASREQIEEANDDQLIDAYQQFLLVTFPNALDAGTKALSRALISQT